MLKTPLYACLCDIVEFSYSLFHDLRQLFTVEHRYYFVILHVIYNLSFTLSTFVIKKSNGAKITSSGSFCISGIKSTRIAGVPIGAIISTNVHPLQPYVAVSAP